MPKHPKCPNCENSSALQSASPDPAQCTKCGTHYEVVGNQLYAVPQKEKRENQHICPECSSRGWIPFST